MSSLKRTADGNEFDSILSSKRAALGASVGDVSTGTQFNLLKMLCPNLAIGSIIGRGGSVINQLNQSTGAKIKLSQNHEFYPATNDRVIAISGSQEAIGVALSELITKMLEVPDRKSDNEKFPTPTPARSLQVRLLIPIGASGVLIGRQGAVIKKLAEQTNCHMQLSELSDAYDTKERIMIINTKSSSIKDLISGAQIAATQLFSEPQLCTYSNTRPSYESSQDPYQQHQGDNTLGGQGLSRRPVMNESSRDGLSSHSNSYLHTQPSHMGLPYNQQQQGGMYQSSGPTGYNQQQGNHGLNSGIVGVGGGYGFDNRSQQHLNGSYGQQQQMQHQQGFGHQMNSQPNFNQTNYGQQQRPGQGQGQNHGSRYPNDQHGGSDSRGSGSGPQSYFQQQQQQQYQQQSNFNNNQSALNDIIPPVFSADGVSITMTMGVPDSLVGAILGRSGCVVKEIMSLSGTQIQISQKDANIQGQNDKFRQVKVVGLQHQVQVAQSMIMAKMQSQPQQQGGR